MRVAILTTDNREHYRTYSERRPCFGAAPEALLQGFKSHDGIEIHLLSCLQQPAASPEKIAPNIWYHGLHVPPLGWLKTGYQGCIRAVRRKLHEIQPDIVHGQGTERNCAMEAVLSGYPNVLTIHGNMRELCRLYGSRPLSYHWFTAYLEDFALSRTHGVFCNSAYTESLVRPRAVRTWRVPNPIQSVYFTPLPVHPTLATPTIVNVGLICARKRQVEMLDLARELHQEGAPVEFQFVGAISSQKEYADAFFSRLSVAEKEGYGRYLGVMEPEKLVGLFDSAHAMLHFPAEEAFGLVAAEALARNLKLFVSATGGLIDIANGVDGSELYASDDWSFLKAGIHRWLQMGAPKPSMAAAEMVKRYHPKEIAKRHLEIYSEVLDGI